MAFRSCVGLLVGRLNLSRFLAQQLVAVPGHQAGPPTRVKLSTFLAAPRPLPERLGDGGLKAGFPVGWLDHGHGHGVFERAASHGQ